MAHYFRAHSACQLSISDRRRSEIANSEDNAYARVFFLLKCQDKLKTRSFLSFANSLSSRDVDFVVQNDRRRKDVRIIDKFIKYIR